MMNLWQQSKPATSWAVLAWQPTGEGRDSSPQLGTGGTTSGHCVQFRLPSTRQAWTHWSKWGRGTQLVRGWSTEAEGGGLVQPGEGEAKGELCCCLPLPNGRLQRRWSQTLLGHAQTQAGTWENPTRYEGKKFHHGGSQILGQGSKKMSRILMLVDTQNTTGQGPEQPALNWPYFELWLG